MFFALITLLAGLALASVAAAFAIFGIMAVFSGAPLSALVMGAVIELGKVVGVSWLYRNWTEKTLLKWVMVPIVITAMALTSIGIFGYLSKAHLEQNAPVANHTLQIERLENRIAAEQAKIDDAENVIAQLDETVSTLIRFEKISGPDGARAVRAGQQDQRDELAAIVTEAQAAIDQYADQKLELSQELRSVELEVGPIRYVAEVIYKDPESNLENAVRILIIAFIFVFDPMAILLLMAANFSLMKRQREKNPPQPLPAFQPPPPPEPEPVSVPEPEPEPIVVVEEKLPEPEVVQPEVVEAPPPPPPKPESQRRTIKMRDLKRANLEKIDATNADVFMDTDSRAKTVANTYGYQYDKPSR